MYVVYDAEGVVEAGSSLLSSWQIWNAPATNPDLLVLDGEVCIIHFQKFVSV